MFDLKKTEERIAEINAEMQRINDAFVEDKAATDLEYLQEYHSKMKALSDELLPLMTAGLDELENNGY